MYGPVAQLVEQWSLKPWGVVSNTTRVTVIFQLLRYGAAYVNATKVAYAKLAFSLLAATNVASALEANRFVGVLLEFSQWHK
jgi:hypothetical protein